MKNDKNSKDLGKAILVAISLMVLIAAYSFLILYPKQKQLKGAGDYISDSSHGEALIGGDFNLLDQNGNPFSSETLKGKYSIIYFGFTFCPDICPTALDIIAKSLKEIEKHNIQINTAFITIDPKRDTPHSLKEYLGHFHKNIAGLSGSEEEIKDVADKFKVYYAIEESTEHKEDYMFNHSSFIYVMDKKGKYLQHFNLTSTPQEIANYIIKLK